MAPWVKDLALSLPRCGFDPWPRGCMLWVQPKKKKKKKKGSGLRLQLWAGGSFNNLGSFSFQHQKNLVLLDGSTVHSMLSNL